MKDKIQVGVVQTSLDHVGAWGVGHRWKDKVKISRNEERRAKAEIRHFFAMLKGLSHTPDIVLFPELSVPLGQVQAVKRSSESLESIVVAGLDYRIVEGFGEPAVSNEAIMVVPKRIDGKRVSRRTEIIHIGKTYPAPKEREQLGKIGVRFLGDPIVWIFKSMHFGSFGVAVCYDFMDLDRIAMYRGKVQTLFIIAYNKDTTSFNYLAEAISRMVFCNVVVCNCGFFGGSVAIAPYRESYDRIVYQHSGKDLTSVQVIDLPVFGISEAQGGDDRYGKEFKSLPPGY